MDRSTKEELVEEYSNIFKNAVSGVLVDYKGITVEELTILRKALYGKNSKFRVIKNSLAKIAAKGTPCEELSEQFVDTRAFVYSDEDIAAPAKIISDEVKKNKKLSMVAGVLVSGEKSEVLDISGVEALSNMPTREDLLVKLLYVMNGPATGFVKVLNEVPASFVRTLSAIADSKN